MGLTEVPKEIFENCPNIKNLYLGRNKLTEFPYHLKNLKYLTQLNLNSNEIDGIITKEIEDFKNLKTLYISENEIGGFEESSIDLKYLYINKNKYGKPDSLFENITKNLPNIQGLIMNNGEVHKIPKSINNMKKLTTLSLNDNAIEVLPEEIYELTSLKTVNLTNSLIKGKFGFTHSLEKCSLEGTDLCFPGENICKSDTYRTCTEDDLRLTKILQEKVYSKDGDNKESFFSRNKLMIIAIIIALILLISFLIYFYYTKKYEEKPIYIKDDNNATYAYNDNEKSRQIMNKLNLSIIVDNKLNDEKINDSSKTLNISNIIQPDKVYVPNSDINNSNIDILSSGNTTQQNINNINDVSQINPQSQLINNINITNSIPQFTVNAPNTSYNDIQLSPQLTNGANNFNIITPLNNQLINNNNSTNIIPQLSNASTSNMVLITPVVMNPIINGSSSNNELDEEKLKLQAKIQKEMLANEEMLLNKKAKNDYKNDDNEQPPPYNDFT